MSKEALGVENIKKIVFFGLAIGNQTAKALEDNKFEFHEALGYLNELTQLPALIESIKRAPAEFLDMSEAEKTEIKEAAAQKFDLKNDQIELAIEESFSFSLDIAKYILRMYRIFKKAA